MSINPKAQAAQQKVSDAIAATVNPIIAAIESGLANPGEWCAPWHRVDPIHLMPYCPTTERHYTAGNRIALAMYGMMTGAAHHWGTFKQWQEIGACVRKGETAHVRILRPATKKQTDTVTGNETTRIIGWAAYPVFHAGQVDGYVMPTPDETLVYHPDDERADIADAFTFAAGIGARVQEGGDRAYYSPQLDHIGMPDRDAFTSADGAWSTIAHELTHWTGHETRLKRDLANKFGDDAYAAEELIAELGAAFTLAAIGRHTEPRPDHAHYLASWLRVLKADPSRLWTAASHAEKGAAYLIEHATIMVPVAA